LKNTDYTDCKRLEPLVREYLGRYCKASRIEHSISVAIMAGSLCERFGLDPGKGFTAGLAHDLMKDRPLQLQWEYARSAVFTPTLDFIAMAIERIEGEKAFADKIIHGPAAAVFLYDEYGLMDRDMLEAIALHSSAAQTMSPLAKVVFIADKMEPRRPYISKEEGMKSETLDLDALLVDALNLTLGWLREKDNAIAQSTLDLYNALKMRETVK
jgi:nicotinate-nucleotide adenylyltransferase